MTRRHWLAAAALALGACAPAAKREPSFDYGEATNTYDLSGEVVQLRPESRIAVIKHEEIKGWMAPMTMEFPVPDAAEYAKLRVGAAVRAKVRTNDAHYWLTDIELEP